MKKLNDDIISALLKKAVGYEAKEVVEEFVVDETNTPVLSKRKVTYKDMPPDVGAVKTIAELLNGDDIKGLTTEELEKEKGRLLGELSKIERGGTDKTHSESKKNKNMRR